MNSDAPLDQLLQRAAQRPRRILFPESEDERVLEAVAQLRERGICEPLLLGAGGMQPFQHAGWESVVAAAEQARGERGDARELLDDRLHYAAGCVRAGLADGMVAGAVHTTSETLRAALRILRPAPAVQAVSSFFLMQLREPTAAGERLLTFADCGLIPEPTVEELAEIAVGTAAEVRSLLGIEPRVAMLSFSTKGSAHHERIDHIHKALKLAREREPQLAIDGELQLDAAIVPEIAALKAPRSAVAGRANLLIFPNLEAGNIGYKLVERLAGAQAVGPLLRGLAYPANDLSRGCSVSDILLAAAVTALQAGPAASSATEES